MSDTVPLGVTSAGLYLMWFGAHYWRDQSTHWPSDPLKAILTGKPIPAPARTAAPHTTVSVQETASSSGGSSPTGGSGTATLPGWDTARASSFNPTRTASGKGINAPDTIASPYLPLGTQVTVQFQGRTQSGTIWDFGPSDTVLASDPNRFLDLAEPMMAKLTGHPSDLISVNYRVTSYGTGRIYRPNNPKTAELRKRWTGK